MTGGIISNNIVENFPGGGVFIYGTGTFSKTGGIIYGSNDPGMTNNGVGSSFAVYEQTGNRWRKETAGAAMRTDDNSFIWDNL
jgi:hypothetical protein